MTMPTFGSGQSSFKGGTNPLVLVDGVPRQMQDIEADEIESFTLLKDAAATAVYGAEGANGVILITSKRGNSQKPKISFRAEGTILEPTRLPTFMNSVETLNLYNEALNNENADTARKTTRQRTPSNFKFNGKPIITLLIAILVICLLGSFVFRKNALAVVVNNNTIGYIKDTSTTEDEFKQLITAKLKETVGNELEINESIKLKPVNGLFKHVSGNSEEVISKVCQSVTYKQQATSIQVEGKPYVTVSNLEQAKEALATTLKNVQSPSRNY